MRKNPEDLLMLQRPMVLFLVFLLPPAPTRELAEMKEKRKEFISQDDSKAMAF